MKKFISIILTLVLVFSVQSASVFAYDADFETASDFLGQLGITDDVTGTENGEITRAEFTAMIVRAMNMASLESPDAGFEDISKNLFKREINTAKALGITNGTSELTFSPDSAVPFEVAAKMLVSALGYTTKAEAFGGYPTGYMNVASSLKLYSGTAASGLVSLRDALILIHNMMISDVAVFEGVQDDNVIVSTHKSKNILTENFGFNYTYGIVSTANGKGINYASAGFDTIEIDGVLYKTETDLSHLLGRRVDLWFDDNKNVKLASATTENNYVTINAEDVETYSDSVLTYYDGEKEKKLRMKRGFSFITNGRSVAFDSSDFFFDHGILTFVDNDADGAYEYVLAQKAEYFVVAGVNNSTCEIYDSRSAHPSVCLESGDDYEVFLTLDGVPATFDDITAGMGCEVYMSEDGGICEVYATSKTVSGKVSEMWDNTVRIDETDYTLSRYILNKGVSVIPGCEYNFIITSDNVIIDIAGNGNSNMQYGYLLGYKSGTGMEAVSQIKLLASDGSIRVYDLKKRVHLDGEVTDYNSSLLTTALTNGRYPRYQVVKYKLSDGLVSHIDTTDYMLSDWTVGQHEDEADSLTMYAQNLSVTYSNHNNVGIPNVPFKAIPAIFNVPEDILTNPSADYDDDMFSCLGSAVLANNSKYTVDVYDYDKYYVPQAAVIYDSSTEASFRNPSQQTTIYVVRGITDYIDEDGETLKRIRVFSGSKYQQFFVEPKTADLVARSYRFPNPGDVVRLSFSARGYINGFAIDVSYDRAAHSIKIHYDGGGYPGSYHGIEGGAASYMTYFGGRVVTAGNGFMAITPDQTPPSISGELGGVVNLNVSGATYMIYDRHTNDVYSASASDVITAMNAGEENASLIAGKSYYYNTNVIIIYAN